MSVVSHDDSLASTEEDQPNLHHFHRFGDIQLVSEEGIVFRTQSQNLARASTVFQAMIEAGDAEFSSIGHKRKLPEETQSKPVHVYTSTKVLDVFLNVISVSEPHIPDIGFIKTLSLYEFCKKYDVLYHVFTLVKAALYARASQDCQWALLSWSAKRNDERVAREALRIMTGKVFLRPKIISKTDPTKFTSCLFWEAMANLPKSWQLDLLELAIRTPGQRNKPSNGGKSQLVEELQVCTDWQEVAYTFYVRALMARSLTAMADTADP
ncbi:uncharacterized protein I303_100809 [Kwoniella dejecticola CBS 10117]|uniref:BTB domain-containing protein n=1 Tax=Kwoniella dejecticola CBS 10117 TaxID=1296121 RepID=A0A1A6AG19_9TREE|nr:uncharacterized protein I303_00811 [Kwoniella dejecticola CBS 10117]OBR88991.1 hypothetical protein I303_00811 [Kwoniella dejecticola CBS 10117]